jgi:ATP-dependent Zn protease
LSKHVIIAIIVLSVLVSMPTAHLAVVKASNETASIEAANASINQAFTNVLAAGKAGGNVTQLLATLNTAGALLAEADNAYQTGSLDNANSLANNARSISIQVNSEAIGLRNSSNSASQSNMVLTAFFSVIAAIIFCELMLLMWRRFKRGYNRKLLTSKPMVA